MASWQPRLPGWRALASVWAVLILGGGGAVAWLGYLGPLPPAPVALVAPASPPAPPPAAPEPGATPRMATPVPPPEPPRAEAPSPEAPPPPGFPAPDQPAVSPRAVATAAEPALTEPGRYGPLPRIGPDGRTPIRAYGRAFDRGDTRPRIAIVVGDIGMNAAQADEALRRLPPEIAFALSPYGHRLGQLAARIRERNTEILAALPMEPNGYPLNDPGDRAMLTAQPLAENMDRLDWALSRFPAYVGAIGAIGGMRGERFAQVPDLIGAVQDALRARGLLYLDPRPGSGNPSRAWGRGVDIVIDEPATRGEIERRLAELERIARERGSALGFAGSPAPVLIERLANWAPALDGNGLALVPPTALIRRPDGLADATATPPRTP
ncbi:MAG TPA: divergent polysaccharide deacetylase family protein [Roseomonas sp.]|jgi:hypothetical protein